MLLAGFVIAGLVSVVLVLTGAPGLLAELLLDGVIAGTAYRRLREVPTQHWLHGARAPHVEANAGAHPHPRGSRARGAVAHAGRRFDRRFLSAVDHEQRCLTRKCSRQAAEAPDSVWARAPGGAAQE